MLAKKLKIYNKQQVLCFWTLSIVLSIFLKIDKTMDNVQKHNTCNNTPSSQTFK
jgi:hypothetical protein